MLSSLCTWYMGLLTTSPLTTKSLTSALISTLGDGGAQYHEERTHAKAMGLQNVSPMNFTYNRRRGLTNFADSVFICGPMLHFGYGWLERAIPISVAVGSASQAAAAHVLIDDFILDTIFIAIMFVSTGIGEGYYLHQILSQCRKDYIPAVKTMWKTSFVLMPLEFCLFRFLPLSLRVLGMNFIEILWDAIVSFMIHKRRKEGNGGSMMEDGMDGSMVGDKLIPN